MHDLYKYFDKFADALFDFQIERKNETFIYLLHLITYKSKVFDQKKYQNV